MSFKSSISTSNQYPQTKYNKIIINSKNDMIYLWATYRHLKAENMIRKRNKTLK